MVKKITTLVALVSLFTAFNAVKAQEMFNKETIHQGETLKLGNYVSVVSKEQAKNLKDVKTCSSADNPILQQLGEELNSYLISTESNSNDTIIDQADSIKIEKKIYDYKDKMLDERYVAIFTDGQKYSLSYAKDVSMSDAITYSLITGLVKNITINSTELKDNDTISLPKEELNKDLSQLFTTEEKNKKTKKQKKDILDISLAFGASYMNWSNKGFYSIPNLKDNFSLEYGIRSDIYLQFKIFPDSPISITTGIGHQSNHFVLKNNFFTYNPIQQDEFVILKGTIKIPYITIPLVLDFNLHHRIKLHLGVISGINYYQEDAGTISRYEENGVMGTHFSEPGFGSVNLFKADAMFGISFGSFTLYTNHSLTNMFEDSYRFQAKPFSFGLMLWW